MSDTGKRLFESLKNQLQGGPDIGSAFGRFGAEVTAEMKRMGTQGTMELSSGLFSGQSNAFVPYGPGQYTPSPENQQKHEQEHSHER